MTYTYNPSAQGGEAGGSQVQGKPGLSNKTLYPERSKWAEATHPTPSHVSKKLNTRNPNSREAETGGVQGHLHLYSRFEVSLGHCRPCLNDL